MIKKKKKPLTGRLNVRVNQKHLDHLTANDVDVAELVRRAIKRAVGML